MAITTLSKLCNGYHFLRSVQNRLVKSVTQPWWKNYCSHFWRQESHITLNVIPY